MRCWRFLLLPLALLALSQLTLPAAEGPRAPAAMTDAEIWQELLTLSATRPETLDGQAKLLETARLTLDALDSRLSELSSRLTIAETGSESLRSSLRSLSMRIAPIERTLSESQLSLRSFAAGMEAETRRLRLCLALVGGAALAAAVSALVLGLTR